MSTGNISLGVKVAGAWSWQPYNLHVPTVLKPGSLALLEPSGPVQACHGIVLPFHQQILFPILHEAETKVSRFSSTWVVTQISIWIAAGASDFSSPNHQSGPGDDTSVYSKCIGVLTERSGRKETGSYSYLHPSSVEVKTVAPYPYSRIYLHEEDMEIFTFTFYTIKIFPS